MNQPLNDKIFLKQLFKKRDRTVYARIFSLTLNEDMREEITGKVTGGSINIDGKSAIRRTCNLTLVSDSTNLTDYYWTLKTKFKLEIGLKNTVNTQYPDIIWFPMGVYVISSFNASRTVNNCTISISGKDKMSFLNGDLGGVFTEQMDLSQYEQLDSNGNVELITLNIRQIIENLVGLYGKEPTYNIIISDVDDSASNLLEYRGQDPMYLIIDSTGKTIQNVTLFGGQKCYNEGSHSQEDIPITLATIQNYFGPTTKNGDLVQFKLDEQNEDGEIINKAPRYYIQKIEYGQTAGYEATDLVYPDQLVANVGETIVSILDKIKNMFADFEYFYDVYGKFRFQKKKTYLNTYYSAEDPTTGLIMNLIDSSEFSWSFDDNTLFTALNNVPNLSNLKNDFTVWGNRKTTTGELPFHMRLSINKKPQRYTSPWQKKEYVSYGSEDDWREIIYQMSVDYMAHKNETNFIQQIAAANPLDYPTGYTGYEEYYLDMFTFWRELYNPLQPTEYILTTGDDKSHGKLYKKLYNGPLTASEIKEKNYPLNSLYIEQDGIYYRWVDTLNFETVLNGLLTNGYSVSSFVEKTEQGEIIDIEKDVDVSKTAVYVLQNRTYKRLCNIPLIQNNIDEASVLYALKRIYQNANGEITVSEYPSNLVQQYPIEIDLNKIPGYNENKVVFGGIYYLDTSKKDSALKKIESIIINSTESIEVSIENIKTAIQNKSQIKINNLVNYNSYIKIYFNAIPEINDDYLIYRWDENTKGYNKLFADYLVEEGLYFKRDYYEKNIITTTKEDGTKEVKVEYINLLSKKGLDKEKVCVFQKKAEEENKFRNLVEIAFNRLNKETQFYILLSNEEAEFEEVETVDASNNLTIKKNKYDWRGKIMGVYETPIPYYYNLTKYKGGYWNQEYINTPHKKPYWLEFIEPFGELEKYSKNKVGNRSKAISDDKATAIDYSEIPLLKFGEVDFNMPKDYKDYFVLSTQGKSAKNVIDELLYNHSYCAETINITSIPIYTLQPNSKIFVSDDTSNIIGEYIITNFSIPLIYNGTMNLQATKVPQRLY